MVCFLLIGCGKRVVSSARNAKTDNWGKVCSCGIDYKGIRDSGVRNPPQLGQWSLLALWCGKTFMTNVQIYLYLGVPFLWLFILTCGAIQAVAIHNIGRNRDLFHSGVRGFLRDYLECVTEVARKLGLRWRKSFPN
jgi:hypothetical protein